MATQKGRAYGQKRENICQSGFNSCKAIKQSEDSGKRHDSGSIGPDTSSGSQKKEVVTAMGPDIRPLLISWGQIFYFTQNST